MPSILSSLLNRARTSLLLVLVLVLPLQSVVQLAAGLQGHRHVHVSSVAETSMLAAVGQLIDRLHAAQDPRLSAHFSVARLGWLASRGDQGGLHAHGGVFHRHEHTSADILDVGDAGDDCGQGSATVFLAWLPGALAVLASAPANGPVALAMSWRSRSVLPPREPPRA